MVGRRAVGDLKGELWTGLGADSQSFFRFKPIVIGTIIGTATLLPQGVGEFRYRSDIRLGMSHGFCVDRFGDFGYRFVLSSRRLLFH